MSQIKVSGNASGTGVFEIAAPNSSTNRTLTLPDNTGTFVSTGSSAVVSQTMLATAVIPLGVGQTWQNLTTTSRVFGTTYTNTTGRPIQIQITWASNTQFATLNFTLNGDAITVNRNPNPTGTNYYYTLSIVIPNGDTYLASGGTLNTWYELR